PGRARTYRCPAPERDLRSPGSHDSPHPVRLRCLNDGMPDCATLLTAYLQAVLHLVTSPHPAPSSAQMPMVPRRLRVITAGTGDYRVGEVLSLDQAYAHAPVVAVCGASGSGRSYLARS